MLIDMILRFFTAYENDFECVTNLKTIAIHYLSNRFVFDLIGTVPCLVTLEFVPALYYLKIWRYFQIERFFEQIKNVQKKVLEVTQIWSKHTAKNIVLVLRSILFLFLTIHIWVWIWLFLANENDDWESKSSSYILLYNMSKKA